MSSVQEKKIEKLFGMDGEERDHKLVRGESAVVAELGRFFGREGRWIGEGVAGCGEEDVVAEALAQGGVGLAGAEKSGAQNGRLRGAGCCVLQRRGADEAQKFFYFGGADKTLDHAGVAGGEDGEGVVESGDGGEAVSYTHLDVYKRQAYRSARRREMGSM